VDILSIELRGVDLLLFNGDDNDNDDDDKVVLTFDGNDAEPFSINLNG
jgi:hypothetical protein